MSLRLFPLPFDGSGDDFRNKVIREQHDVSDQLNLPYKIIVLNKGSFYKKGLIITDSFQNELKVDLDYQTTMFNQTVFRKTGLEACSVIVINNTNLKGKLYITAQMVGGEHCHLGKDIISQSLGLLNNTRKLNFKNIKELPDTFELNKHMHPYWDLYSFAPRTLKVKRMVDIFASTIVKDLQEVYVYFNGKMDAHVEEKNHLDRVYTDHTNNMENPHRLTKAQINLGSVMNGRIPNESESKSFSRDLLNIYLTPLAAKQSLTEHVLTRLNEHIADVSNPHEVTAGQLNSLTELEIDALGFEYYNRGETVDFTYRLGGSKNPTEYNTLTTGLTFPEAFNLARSNMPAPEIKTGFLKVTNLTNATPVEPSVLIPLANGKLGWRALSDIQIALGGEAVTVYHLNAASYPDEGSVVGLANASISPTNLADGTLLLVKTVWSRSRNYGNAADSNYAYSTTMLVVRGGVWVM